MTKKRISPKNLQQLEKTNKSFGKTIFSKKLGPTRKYGKRLRKSLQTKTIFSKKAQKIQKASKRFGKKIRKNLKNSKKFSKRKSGSGESLWKALKSVKKIRKIPKTSRKSGKTKKSYGIRSKPHDSFFKAVFSHKVFAKELAQLTLTPKELKLCDLSKLKVDKNSFKGKIMDLILSLPLKVKPLKQLKLIILFEHKFKYDKALFKQVLGYQTRIYESYKQTVIVLPALFYHGKEDWKWELSFQKGILGKFLKNIPLTFRKSMIEYHLRFLNAGGKKFKQALNNEDFKSAVVFEILDRLPRLKEEGLTKEALKETEALFCKFLERLSSSKKWVCVLLKYMRAMGISRLQWEEWEQLAIKKKLLKRGGFMDIREEFREEGRRLGWRKGRLVGMQAGMQAGRKEREQEVALNMLRKQSSISFISEVTGLPVAEIKKLKNGNKT